MRVKTKGIITGLLFAVFISLLALFIAIIPKSTTTASAATTPKYTVSFDYSASYTYGTGGGATQYPSSGTGVFSASFTYGANRTRNTLSVVMYGGSASGTGSFINGTYIDSTDITVEIISSVSMTVSITDSNGTKVGSRNKKASASGLSEGTYKVSISGSGGGTINSRAGWGYNFKGNYEFKIDGGAPIINGASLSQTGVYKNNTFTVTASDSGSGVKAIYRRAPNESMFYSVGSSSVTVNKGSANGTYTFYAEDNAGNKSKYYYVNFDDILPEITVTNAEFWQNTNKSFTVNSSDNSGSCTLYYKVDDGSWKSCNGNSYTVSDYANDGRYYFYAKDAYGNMTQEKWVEFGAELNGEFVKSDTDNSVYFTWDRASWTATLDGKSYSKGTWIREEGEHTIKLSSKTKSAVYPYTINHYYIESMESPTCISGGYLQYDCIQCGDTYTNYSIEEMGHYYVASTIAPTCTTGGYTTYTCTRCGDAYKDNFTNAYGHNYESTFQPATCTEYGRTIFTCQLCGHSYNENDGTFPTGHNYTNTIITEPNCTSTGMRRSVCDTCGDTFDTVIAANGHSYSITDVKSKNGITTRTYHCSSCGHTYKQELGDQYEEVSNYVEYLFIQYSPYMWWVLLAAAGIWSIVIGVMIAIAHKNEDKEKARKMLINYVIGLVVIAVIVVACPFLIRGIAALVT